MSTETMSALFPNTSSAPRILLGTDQSIKYWLISRYQGRKSGLRGQSPGSLTHDLGKPLCLSEPQFPSLPNEGNGPDALQGSFEDFQS